VRTPLRYPAEKIVYSIRGGEPDEWAGPYPSMVDFPAINPVASVAVFTRGPAPGFIPPGTLVDVRILRPLALIRRDLHIENFRLDDYVVR